MQNRLQFIRCTCFSTPKKKDSELMLLGATTAFILFYSPFFSLLCCTLDAFSPLGIIVRIGGSSLHSRLRSLGELELRGWDPSDAQWSPDPDGLQTNTFPIPKKEMQLLQWHDLDSFSYFSGPCQLGRITGTARLHGLHSNLLTFLCFFVLIFRTCSDP